MIELHGIVVDLDLCVGCYACEIACKQESNVPEGTRWIQVVTIGPATVNGEKQMDFLPVMTAGCTLCKHRLDQNLEPRCVENCPTQAFTFYKSESDIIGALRSKKRLQVCKLDGLRFTFG